MKPDDLCHAEEMFNRFRREHGANNVTLTVCRPDGHTVSQNVPLDIFDAIVALARDGLVLRAMREECVPASGEAVRPAKGPGNEAFIALSMAFAVLAALPFWPGDRVRAYAGPPCRYVRRVGSGYHVVQVQVEETGRLQLVPPDVLRRD